jgi:predicted chitinase
MATTLQLTPAALRKIFPAAPQIYLDALMAHSAALDKAGITATRTRLAYCLANVEHECGGFTIKNLTENINYTHARAAQIWPSRFPGGAGQVAQKYGSGPGWQLAMFDDVYGNRMGNRPGTRDGSRFIGRGACQHTGRDGYVEMERRTRIPCTASPELAAAPENQADLIAAFWSWKGMNPLADAGNFTGVVKRWNGGTIGMADRQHRMAGNASAIAALEMREVLRELPGGPRPGEPPPKSVTDAATTNERRARAGGGAAAGAGTAGEVANAGAQQPVLSPMATYTLIGVGAVIFAVAVILIVCKVKKVRENWV